MSKDPHWPEQAHTDVKAQQGGVAAGRDIHGDVFTGPVYLAPSQTSTSRRPNQIPLPASSTVHRPDAVVPIKNLLIEDSDEQHLQRPVAIVGLGGAGKSTVASLLAAEPDVLSRYSEGTLWASLGLAPGERILDFQRAWASALGYGQFAFTTPEAAAAELRSALVGRRVLLVVDDVWASDDLAAFSVGGPGSRLLITTRDYRLAEQTGALIFEIPLMPADLAVELLEHRLGRPITQDERPTVEKLITRLGYLPLALDLAAGQVGGGVGWNELLTDLMTDIARLETLEDAWNDTGDDQRRSHGLLASLRRSVARLPVEGQNAFAWLGILAPDAIIMPAIASTVWAATVRDAARTLRSLWARALLLSVEGSGVQDGRVYKLHSLTGDFARYVLAQRSPDSGSENLARKSSALAAWHRELLVRYSRKQISPQWSSISDDGYIIEHLTWHMEKGNREAWIHELLWEQDVEERNAWYQLRERDGGGGFGSDVARAWRLSERAARDPQAVTSEDSITPALCVVRYALISASLASVSATLPPWLAGQLIRRGLWSAEAALTAARLQKGTKELGSALAGIAPHLDGDLAKVALALAREEPVGGQRTTALMFLGLRLPGEAPRRDILLEAIAASRDAGDVDDQAGFLTELRETLPTSVDIDVRDAIVARAAEIYSEIDDPMTFAHLLAAIVTDLDAEDRRQAVKETLKAVRFTLNAMNSGLVSGVEDEIAAVVRRIAPYLATRTRRGIVEAAGEVVDRMDQPGSRASALLDLAYAATGEHRSAFVSNAKKCIREAAEEKLGNVSFDDFWLDVLPKLLEFCPQEERSVLVRDAWTKVRIMSEWWRLRGELVIGPHLETSSAEEASADLLYLLRSRPDLLEDIGILEDDTRWLEDILDSLPQEASQNVLRDARIAARQIGDDAAGAQAVLALARNLPPGATRDGVVNTVSMAIPSSAESWTADDRLGIAESFCDVGALQAAAVALKHYADANPWWLKVGRFAACVRATLPALGTEDRDDLLGVLLHAGMKESGLNRSAEGLDVVVAEASDSLFRETIQAVSNIQDQVERAASLPRLLPRLTGKERAATLAEAKRAIEQLEPGSDKTVALGELLLCVNDSELEELWSMVQSLPSAASRADAVKAVADRLSGQRLSQIVEHFEDEFINADPPELPLRSFEGLAKYLNRDRLSSFLNKIRMAPKGLWRLKAMAAAVDALDSQARTEAAAEVLRSLHEDLVAERAAFSSHGDYGLGALVASVAPHLPETSLELAMEYAQALDSITERTTAIRSVADRVALVDSIRVDIWLRAMRRSGERSRDTALTDLGALSSLMGQIGGSKLVEESILAVESVVRWWP